MRSTLAVRQSYMEVSIKPSETPIQKLAQGFGFWEFDPKLKKISLGKAALNILNLKDDSGLSYDFLKVNLSNDHRNKYSFFCKEVFEELNSSSVKLLIQFDSEIKWIEVKADYDRSKNIIQGFIQDITVSKKNQLQNSIKTNLRSKIEAITSTGTFEWDLNKDYLICSDQFFHIAQLQGYNENNVLSKSVFFSLIENQRQNFILDVMHDSVTYNNEFEVTFHTTGAKRKKIKLYGYPQGDLKNKRLIGLIVDITNLTQGDESIIRGQDEERKRISLEIHDSVGQKLVAIKYMLALFKITKDFGHFEKLNSSMDDIIDEIRTITHNLSTQIVKEIGLKNAVGQLLSECAKVLNATKDYDYDIPDEVDIPDNTGKTIYRIAQEALSNSMKYSGATELGISLKYQNKQINININDNGVGFVKKGIKKDGIGLQNIKQRVSYLNGFLKMESAKNSGTKIKIRIPVQ